MSEENHDDYCAGYHHGEGKGYDDGRYAMLDELRDVISDMLVEYRTEREAKWQQRGYGALSLRLAEREAALRALAERLKLTLHSTLAG